MARGCIVRTQRKDGAIVYSIKYRDLEGRQIKKAIGSNKKQAEKALGEIMSEIHAGTYRKVQEIGFKDFCDRWLTDYASVNTRPRTYAGYRSYIENHLKPFFGNRNISEIGTETVQRYVSAKVVEGKLSHRAIGHSLTIFKGIMGTAFDWGYIKQVPGARVKKPKVPHKEMEYLSPDEVHKLLEACNPADKVLFLTAVFTGCRRSELLAIQWADIDLNESTIRVNKGLYKGKLVDTKTEHSRRRISVPASVLNALMDHKLTCPASEMDLVFCTKQGNPYHPDWVYKKKFLPALRIAGIREMGMHALRHTCATLMIAANVQPKAIQAHLGHSSIQVTMDLYGHLLPSTQKDAAARLEGVLLGTETVKA